MAHITKLGGISRIESEAIRNCGINTVEDLWLRISEEHDSGLKSLVNQTGISKNRLIDLLAAEGMRQPGRFGSTWLRNHWLDILVLGIALVLAFCVWRSL